MCSWIIKWLWRFEEFRSRGHGSALTQSTPLKTGANREV